MFPLCALVAHAEMSKNRLVPDEAMDARRFPRRTRPADLMLYPQVARDEPTDPTYEDPQVVASLSNVSQSGMGLVHEDPMPPGTVFGVDWEHAGACVPLTLEVVHSRELAPRLYRSGARVVSGPCIPLDADAAAPAAQSGAPAASAAPSVQPTVVRVVESPAVAAVIVPESRTRPAATATSNGLPFMRIDAPAPGDDDEIPAPAGTLRISPHAPRFATTQRIAGTSPCGFDRRVEVCRVGRKLWIYIHSPGKKNGWGIYVDPAEFDTAMSAIRDQVSHPTIAALAA